MSENEHTGNILHSITLVIVFFTLFIFLFYKTKAADDFINFIDSDDAVKEEQIHQSAPELPHINGAPSVPIFVYHSVRPYVIGESKMQDAYDITPQLFEQELKYLQDNGYKTITPDELNDYFTNNGATSVDKSVIITFDDGWENQYNYAYPLLKKYNMKATFYIYTMPIGHNHFLTWDQVLEMKNNGMNIGSHTVNHPYLKKTNDIDLKNEMTESKKIIESHIGESVNNFASPYGYSDDRIVSFIKEAGYKTGRTLFKGVHQDDMFILKAYLANDNFNDFKFILSVK